ncbi:hypothetical protein AAFF_G00245720 [Aldrovandia affinis]|uniref:Uncharacterized protein n=1 Tax=Aldrovandia affinis TaxID=143900 RepID=A0AAD7SU13_9TELE|nr:hypothetical protein AAFF_G00245720 [Aldrovandia affinis]
MSVGVHADDGGGNALTTTIDSIKKRKEEEKQAKDKEGIKLLGVTFQTDGRGNWSWEKNLRHIWKKIGSWSTRPLTMMGPCRIQEQQRQWRIINTVKQVLWEMRNIKAFQKQTVDLVTPYNGIGGTS